MRYYLFCPGHLVTRGGEREIRYVSDRVGIDVFRSITLCTRDFKALFKADIYINFISEFD